MNALFAATRAFFESAVWLFALLPTLIVLEHTIYLYFTRPKDPKKTRAISLTGGADEALQVGVAAAQNAFEANFGGWALGLRYLVPGLLTGLTGLLVLTFLFSRTQPVIIEWNDKALEAARLGALGAYLWILLYLSRRAIRHDLTSGGTTVCAITLVLGPLLAGTLGYLLRGSLGANAEAQASSWGPQALFVAAGMAPRRFAVAVLEAVRKLWAPEEATTPVPSRIVPLSQIRGVTPDIEERLGEEGVYDAATLSMADPLALYRNTSFTLRQILWWMDEALLIMFLPEHWNALQKEGISGAIDLASYGRGAQAPGVPDPLQVLADKIKMERTSLDTVVRRLGDDGQVQMAWVLYQTASAPEQNEANGAQGGGAAGVSHPA